MKLRVLLWSLSPKNSTTEGQALGDHPEAARSLEEGRGPTVMERFRRSRNGRAPNDLRFEDG